MQHTPAQQTIAAQALNRVLRSPHGWDQSVWVCNTSRCWGGWVDYYANRDSGAWMAADDANRAEPRVRSSLDWSNSTPIRASQALGWGEAVVGPADWVNVEFLEQAFDLRTGLIDLFDLVVVEFSLQPTPEFESVKAHGMELRVLREDYV